MKRKILGITFKDGEPNKWIWVKTRIQDLVSRATKYIQSIATSGNNICYKILFSIFYHKNETQFVKILFIKYDVFD